MQAESEEDQNPLLQASTNQARAREARRGKENEIVSQMVMGLGNFLAARNFTQEYSSLQNEFKSIRTTLNHPNSCSTNQKSRKSRLAVSPARVIRLLLRPPVISAACFSLLMLVSLIILLGLSLVAHQRQYQREISDRKAQAEFEAKLRESLTVQSECGAFVGSLEGGAIGFHGIPYASPPVGKRRWTRPRPIWLDKDLCRPNKTQENSNWSIESHCAQLSPITRRFTGREDCLYLDIYTPQISSSEGSQKLPVLVYIHGGFFAFGSSGQGQVNWMKARPSGQLASELQVVLVAFNYRLQALGFLASLELAQNNGPDGSEGNYGLWDQLVALNWIKRNIESFSGDPNNIVLFGPDSASSIGLALITRQNQQLESSSDRTIEMLEDGNNFHQLFRAIWLTNPTLYFNVPSETQNRLDRRKIPLDLSNETAQLDCIRKSNMTSGYDHLDKSMINLVDCLINLDPELVIRRFLDNDDPSDRLDDQNSLPIHGIHADQFVNVDGELVKTSYPFKTQVDIPFPENFIGNRKDLLIGSTAQAAEFWPCPRNLDHWSWRDFRRYVSTSLNSFNSGTYNKASRLYQVLKVASNQSDTQTEYTHRDPKEVYLTMVSDIRQVCPVNELSRQLRNQKHRVHRYVIETIPSGNISAYLSHNDTKFAFHTWDLQAFFGFASSSLGLRGGQIHEKDIEFQKNIRQMVRDFAYDTKNHQRYHQEIGFNLFTRNGQVKWVNESEYKQEECKFWLDHIGDSYAWIS